MAQFTIEGKIEYQDLGTGFWGIIADDGGKYRPMNLPEDLEKEGLHVSITAEEHKNAISLFMWGKTVKILDYSSK